MDTRGFADTTFACRLFAAAGVLARTIHLQTPPETIHVHDEATGLEFVYHRLYRAEWANCEGDWVAIYLFDRIA